MMELFIGFILGVISTLILGVVSGVIANYISEKRRPVLLRIIEWCEDRDGGSYDPREDGLYVINRWSPSRLLTEDRLFTTIDLTPPTVSWFDAEEWSVEVANQAENYAGDVCYLVNYRIDHRESRLTNEFHMTLARCDYSEHFATRSLLEKHPEIHDRIKHCIQTDPIEYIRQPCPSIIAINVVVLSNKGNFLAIERSRAVDTARGVWTVGPFETMNLGVTQLNGAIFRHGCLPRLDSISSRRYSGPS